MLVASASPRGQGTPGVPGLLPGVFDSAWDRQGLGRRDSPFGDRFIYRDYYAGQTSVSLA